MERTEKSILFLTRGDSLSAQGSSLKGNPRRALIDEDGVPGIITFDGQNEKSREGETGGN
jgi:hypothetical protein